ncbi:MAG: TIGR02710 family CRISPR-associated CARF protein [Desulfomonilia bacterium]
MKNILILSVGGSAGPIVNAVKDTRPQPDFVYFFCSTGPNGSCQTIDSPGNPCGDTRKSKCPECGTEHYIGDPKGKSIVTQARLDADHYGVVTVDDPDDLNECMQVLKKLGKTIESRHGPDCRIIANYTGGTKTMSLAMGLIGILSEQWDLSINRGPRIDLIKVRGGDMPVAVEKWRIYADIQMKAVREAIDDFDYNQAMHMIGALLSRPLDKKFRDRLMSSHQICRAFDAWDRFDHKKALELLEPHSKSQHESIILLKRLLGLIEGSGYEQVGDLLNNAERKAHRKNYDDAVARLYRATELFAQIRLELKYQLRSGNIELGDLRKDLQEEYAPFVGDKGKILLGLKNDYELLFRLDDLLGKLYMEQKSKIISTLKTRNQSILAHGLTPLTESDYHSAHENLAGFILKAAHCADIKIKVPQLPREGIIE